MLAGAVCVLMLAQCTQNPHPQDLKERTIEVNGIAEREVEPDEVYFTLTLQEYRKQGKKVSLADMEKALLERAAKLGLKKENLKLENISGYSYGYYYYGYSYRQRKDDMMSTASYRVKLARAEQMDELLGENGQLNVTTVYLTHFANSQKEKISDELRRTALMLTRDKAAKLLAAVGEEVGDVLSISEEGARAVQQASYYPYGYYYGAAEERSANATDAATAGGGQAAVSPRNIKLRAEMKVVYRIR